MGSYPVALLTAIRSLSGLAMLTPFLLRDGMDREWRAKRPAPRALRAGLLVVEGSVFGALFFADTPRPATLPGAGLTVVSGLFTARMNRPQGRCAPVVVT